MTTSALLQKLKIPAEYAWYEKVVDQDVIARLGAWKDATIATLLEIRTFLESNPTLSLAEQANILSTTASFDGSDPWITPDSRNAAQDILGHFEPLQPALLVQILSEHIKPCFLSNPHPRLNAAGRKLPRPAGGPMASQDFYDSQTWKSSLGIVNVLSWCVQHIPSESYENQWHLVIPPIMTLLDEYEPKYKQRGAVIVSEMLRHVPGQLLKRTGVDGLVRSSLNNCLSYLNNFETTELIRTSVAALLSLTLLTTDVGSADRFDQLSELLGDGIIAGVWFYGYENPEAILATLYTLPPVLRALNVGSARYIKALITQLVHVLKSESINRTQVEMQIISLQVLRIIMEECAPSIPRWKGTILDGIARCWVMLKESDAEFDHLRTELRHTCNALGESCPSVIEDEYRKLLETDEAVFRSLLDMSNDRKG